MSDTWKSHAKTSLFFQRQWTILPLALFLLVQLLLALHGQVASAEEKEPQVPDYRAEGQNCGRSDLRPWLEKIGLPRVRHQGGRLSPLSFQLTEAASLKTGKPLSARSFEHAFDHSSFSLEDQFQAPLKSKRSQKQFRPLVCLESDVPSEDIESSRLARLRFIAQALKDSNVERVGLESLLSFDDVFSSERFHRASDSPRTCGTLKVRFPAIKRFFLGHRGSLLELRKQISFLLASNQMPLLKTADSVLSIAGSRLSVESGVCEYLVRGYEGSVCAAGSDSNCEEGSRWENRDQILSAVQSAWSFE